MKLGIVGQGAIGSLFAYYYRLLSPTLLVKTLDTPPKNLLTIDGVKVILEFKTVDISKGNLSEDRNEHFDAIIIAVKGYQMAQLIAQLTTWLPLQTRLILIQNGMGGAQLLAKAFPKHRIYAGTTTDAVFSVDKDTYQITANGKLDIGPLWNMSSCQWYKPKITNHIEEKKWALKCVSNHPNYEYHEDIAHALYRKLAINAVINPLTASLQVKNGQLRQYPTQVNKLKAELFEVYSAANIIYSEQVLSEAIDNVIVTTSNNWSSMQQDVEHQRQTENETVLGYIMALATQYDVEVPYITQLYETIKEFDLHNKLLS